MSRVIVVADAHLGQVPPAVGRAFHTFLEEIPRPGDHLLLTGDLFDFWFEYQSVIPRKHFATVAKLQEVRARGIPITFVGGNHDRWGGSFFTEDLGIEFFGGEAELDLVAQIRRGLERDEFVLHYQPIVDLRRGAVVGCEALVRWRRGGKLLLPGVFLEAMENAMPGRPVFNTRMAEYEDTIIKGLMPVWEGKEGANKAYLDELTRGLYATDASPFQVTPLGVAAPRDADDLAVLVKYAYETGVPLVPRGAGTGLAGEALGPGLVVDLSVHLRAELSLSGVPAVTTRRHDPHILPW